MTNRWLPAGCALVLALSGCGGEEPAPEPAPPAGYVVSDEEHRQAEARKHYEAGLAAEARGDYAAAREELIQAQSFVAGYEDTDRRLVALAAVIATQRAWEDGQATADAMRKAELAVAYALALRDRPAAYRDLHQARLLFEKAAEEDPQNARAYVGLGVVAAERGSLGESIEMCALATEADPQGAEAHYELAFLYRTVDGSQDPEKALHHARRAVELSAEPGARYFEMLAVCCHALGEIDGAVDAMQKAVAASDDPRYARRLDAYRAELGPPPGEAVPPPPEMPPEPPTEPGQDPMDMPPFDQPPPEQPLPEQPPPELPPPEQPPPETPPTPPEQPPPPPPDLGGDY